MKGYSRRLKVIVQTLMIIAIIIVVNLISAELYTYVDLTEDKRFTLEESTLDLLEDVDDIVTIDLLLEGNMTAGLSQLRERTLEIIKEFKSVNPNLEYKSINPSKGTTEQKNQIRKNLSIDGIYPQNLMIVENDQRVEKLIYPYAIIKYGTVKVPVNLLEPMGRGESEEAAINRSTTLLEYKLISSIEKLFRKKIPIIALTEGNGELLQEQTAKLSTEIGRTSEVLYINLDSMYQIEKEIDVLIIAGPKRKVSDKSQFKIDQYLMNGGRIIWLVDQFAVNLDSLNNNSIYVPRKYENGLESMLFKYGIRVNSDLVLDLENTRIPQVIGQQGGEAQTQLFNWVYHPLLQANQESPIVKNIDRVSSTFVSSIDILDNDKGITYTPLLTSSKYARRQIYPMRLSFEILRVEQKVEAYNKSFLPVAVMLEGEFESFFKNRVTEEMKTGLDQIGSSFKEKSAATSQVIISDSDIIKNLYDAKNNRISPMGYNKWSESIYKGNQDFIINVIDYLLDDYGLIDARNKSQKLRILNQVEIQENTSKWQIINVVMPVVIVVLFGLLYNYIRRRRYAS